MESTWSQPTLCTRLVLNDGSEVEAQITKEALNQWSTLPRNVAFTMEVNAACLKPYRAQTKTGIENTTCLRFMYPNPSLQRAAETFPLHILTTRTCVKLENMEQTPDDAIFNIAGIVEKVGPPPNHSEQTLPKRSIELRNAEWMVKVELIGKLAACPPELGATICLISVKKNNYMGLQTLETTRLSWFLQNPPWLTIQTKEVGTPERKALKAESLMPVAVSDLENAPTNEARCIDAAMVPLDDSIFEDALWFGENADRMRLPVNLRDTTGTVKATLWDSEFGNMIDYNIDELGQLFAACEDGEEHKTAFLHALNTNANKHMRWILRPRLWVKDSGEEVLQWNVASVIEIPS